VHTVAEAAEYIPATQFSQLDEPAVPWKVPVPQLEQIVADDTEYLPAAQTPVTAVRPEVAQ